jgi:hypothetical protein
LSAATNMGLDAGHGWIDRHPATGALIAGRTVPMWDQVMELVRKAHLAFQDWAVIGWDVGVLADGPWIVEGNCGPDVDLIQRPLRAPFGSGRLGALLAFHLQQACLTQVSSRRRGFTRSPQLGLASHAAAGIEALSIKLSPKLIQSINLQATGMGSFPG